MSAGETFTNAAISIVGEVDTLTFSGTSNETVTILMTKTGGMGSYPYFELHAPNGTIVALPDSYGVSSFLDGYRLTQTGTYQILCRDDVGNETFTYNLTLIKNPGPNAADEDASVILAGETLTNRSIDLPSDMDAYTFSGTSNETVTILMSRTGQTGYYPYFELHAPNGTIVAFPDSYVVRSFLDGYRLTQTGTYQIVCRGDIGEEMFTYNLTLIKNPGPNAADEDASVILAGETLTNRSINVAADLDVYTFSGASNEVVTILMAKTGGTGSYPYFHLQAPDGLIVALPTYDSTIAIKDAYRLTQTGTYQILCRDDVGNETFDYNLTFVKNPGPNFLDIGDSGPTIQPGQVLTNSIGEPSDIDALSFYAIAGDTVTLSMTKIGGSGNNPNLQIQSPDGTVLANATGLSSATIKLDCLVQTGNYLVICRNDGGNATFTYRLSLTQSPIELPSGGTNQYLTTYACSDHHIYLRWNVNATGFALQTTTNLAPPTWSSVTHTSYTIADHFYVDLGLPTNQMAFYRLACTNGTCGQ